VWGKAYDSIFSYILARKKGYWSASRLGYPLGTNWHGLQGRWDSLERTRIHHDAAHDDDGNHPVSPLLNLLKSSGYFTYQQVQHSKILHGAYILFNCFVCNFSSYSIN